MRDGKPKERFYKVLGHETAQDRPRVAGDLTEVVECERKAHRKHEEAETQGEEVGAQPRDIGWPPQTNYSANDNLQRAAKKSAKVHVARTGHASF